MKGISKQSQKNQKNIRVVWGIKAGNDKKEAVVWVFAMLCNDGKLSQVWKIVFQS